MLPLAAENSHLEVGETKHCDCGHRVSYQPQPQYDAWKALGDALNRTGRPIYCAFTSPDLWIFSHVETFRTRLI